MPLALHLENTGALVGAIGKPTFSAEFFRLFGEALDVDRCVAFALTDRLAPKLLVADGRDSGVRRDLQTRAREFEGGWCMRDLYVRKLLAQPSDSTSVCSAEPQEDEEYRRKFYDETRIDEEIVVLSQHEGIRSYVGFFRTRNQPRFARHDHDRVHRHANFLVRLIGRHFELMTQANTPTADDSRRDTAEICQLLQSDCRQLTYREAEICAGIILGQSTTAIGLTCGISPNTVMTHRKRAYAKLRLSSQHELLHRYYAKIMARTRAS